MKKILLQHGVLDYRIDVNFPKHEQKLIKDALREIKDKKKIERKK